MAVMTETMQIRKLSQNIGAEVTGIDLRQPIDAETRRRLHDAAVENIALVIRDQSFTPEQFFAAVQLFGEPTEQDHPRYSFPHLPLVKSHSNRNLDVNGNPVKEGLRWHTDGTHRLRPPKFTILYALEVPDTGGNTNIVNMRKGYASLPDDLKARIEGMQTANVRLGSSSRATYSANNMALMAAGEHKPTLHPLVRTNPETGAKALYVNPNKVEHIVGMEPEESQLFLEDLLARAIRPEFVYSHAWRVGDMLLWDNRSSQHKVSFDYDPKQHRHMYHAMTLGERPV